MPLIKYQIRNEYSLADPELYRTADKDDPEALLEGVAMAGLVGVLRQLGDLAEVAAGIFHDLHEEVMATAARGHGLMVRVQQLEAELPSVEKAFLSQTNHSPFYYNPGADWHPKLHMDQNVIARGDLPRFIMDSYEECRGPPRLFLLDKFDVAGAGACLKRYTDPSVFKVEASSTKMSNVEVQREKKIRRIKKKAVRMRNGETPEVLPTAHAKLHQLFLEERIENGISDPARRVKLKRRLPAFPLDSQPGTSYMEKFLSIASPEHKMVHEICINSSPLRLHFHNCSDSGPEILEIGMVTPLREEALKKSSPCSSPSLGRLLKPSFNELHDNIGTEEILTESEPSYKLEADDALPSLDRVLDEKEITVDGETKLEGSVDGYHSEDIGGEIDNYMDALATMESEMETDTVYRTKSDQAFLNIKKVGTESDLCDEHLKIHFSDYQPTLNSIAFDDGNNSIRKGVSNSSYHDTPSILAENAPVIGDFSAKDLLPETFEDEASDVFPNQFSNTQEVLMGKSLEDVMPAGLLAEVDEIASRWSELGQASTSSSLADSIPSHLPTDPEDIMMEGILTREMDEVSSKWAKDYPAVISSEEDKEDFHDNLPCSINNLSDIASWKEVPPADIADNHPMNVLNEDLNAFSDVATHSSKMLEAPKEESGENLLDGVLQTEYLEENVTREVSDHQVSLPSHEISLMEEQSSVPTLQESETCKLHSVASETDNATEPVEHEAINSPHKLDAPDAVEQQMLKIADDFANGNVSYSGEQDTDGPPSTDNGEKMCIINSNADLVRSDVSTLEVISDVSNCVGLALLTELCAHSVGEAAEAIQLETVPEATVVTSPSYEINALVSPMDFRVLQEKTLGDLSRVEQNGLQINEASVPQNYEQSDTQEVVCRNAVASPNSSSILSNAVTDNLPKSDSLDTIHVISLAMEVKDSLFLDDATTIVSSSEHIGPDYVSESTQHFDYIDNAEEASSSALGQRAAASTNLNSILYNTEEAKNVLHLNDAIHVMSLAMEVEDKFHLDDGTTIPSLSEHIGSDFVSEPTHNFDCVDNAEEASSSVPSEQAPASPNLHSILYNTEEPKNDLHLNDAATFPLSSEHNSYDIASAWQSNLLEKIEKASFATAFHSADPSTSSEKKVDLQYDQLNEESQFSTEATMVSHSEQTVTSDDVDHAQQFNISPQSCQQPQSPVSDSFSGNGDNIVPEKNTVPSSTIFPEQAMVPSSMIFPCISLLPEPNQIELEEMPPLPPLPPMQWRMGKLQRTSLTPETDVMPDKVNPFPLLLPSPAEKKLEMGNPAIEGDIPQPSDSFSPFSATKDENYKQSLQMQKMDAHGCTQDHSSTSDSIKSANPFLTLPAREMPQHVDCAEVGENMRPCLNPVSAVTCSVSMHVSGPVFEHINQAQSEVNLADNKIDCGTGTLEEKVTNPVGATPPFEDWQPQQISTTSDGEISLSAVEDGKPNGKMKLPWPRNPLIDDVAALDKSKLRKATDRILPQIPKVDEKHSLLEQIRTKSFNLKPAATVRPSIQGPATNLKVAAILEKANAIRQALAGSDEDDDADCWSDS